MYLELEGCLRGVQAAENQDVGNQTFKSREEGDSMGDKRFWATSTRIMPQKVGEVGGAEGAESILKF